MTTIEIENAVEELRKALKLIDVGAVAGWSLTTKSGGGRIVSTPTGVLRIGANLSRDGAANALSRMHLKGFLQAATRPKRARPKVKIEEPPAAAPTVATEGNPYDVAYLPDFENRERSEQIAAIEHRYYGDVAEWKSALPLPPANDGFVDRHCVITPEMAQQILDECADDSDSPQKWNRRLSKARAGEYADMMRRGHWALISQGYSFDREGRLRDGRTRLVACTMAGVPIPAKLSYNQNPDDYSMYDGNRSRTGADTLYVGGDEYGVQDRHAAAYATGRLIVSATRTDGGGGLVHPARWPKKVPRDRVTALIASQPGVVSQCVTDTHIMRRKPLGMLHAAAAAALYFARQAYPSGPHDEFIYGVTEGVDLQENGLPKNDPRLVLHRNVTRARLTKRQVDLQLHLALYLKAWNLFAGGSTITVLTWKASEDFPEPIHG